METEKTSRICVTCRRPCPVHYSKQSNYFNKHHEHSIKGHFTNANEHIPSNFAYKAKV